MRKPAVNEALRKKALKGLKEREPFCDKEDRFEPTQRGNYNFTLEGDHYIKTASQKFREITDLTEKLKNL
jgi:hypothetical protein